MAFAEETNEPDDVCDSQWVLLYTAAAYSNGTYSEADQLTTANFFNHFVDACRSGPRANALAKAKEMIPKPKLRSNKDAIQYVCTLENFVRGMEGMELKPCNSTSLLQRWRHAESYI